MASVKGVVTNFIEKTYKIKIGNDWIIFGIRGCTPDKDGDLMSNVQIFNKYDDAIGIINKDERYVYTGTVEAGKKYTSAPMNPNGAFYLKNGLYIAQRAKHFGEEAFNIYSKYPSGKVEGYRDTARKGIHPLLQDKNAKIYTDGTGIDIHAGGNDITNVDGWSAGCQVLFGDWNSANWKEFKNTLYASKQKTFLYCLFDYSDIKEEYEK